MNNNKARELPCELVQDLIPLYADNLVSEKTREIIDEHTAQCPACAKAVREAVDSLKGDFNCEPVNYEEKDVDYLRKVRAGSRKKIIAGVCITLCLVLLSAGFKLFVYGSPDYGYTVGISSEAPADSDADYTVKGSFMSSSAVFSRYKIKADGDGGEELIVYSCLASPFNRDGSFSIDCSVNAKYLDINGTRIMADGTVYNAALAKQLYSAAHPYVGDMPANSELAAALGIPEKAGAYYNRLHTESEPYGWEFVFRESKDKDKQKEITGRMRTYAVVLLALVDNCDEIMWSFAADIDDAPDEPEYKVTSDDADRLLGADVKSFGESPEKVMELLLKLSL